MYLTQMGKRKKRERAGRALRRNGSRTRGGASYSWSCGPAVLLNETDTAPTPLFYQNAELSSNDFILSCTSTREDGPLENAWKADSTQTSEHCSVSNNGVIYRAADKECVLIIKSGEAFRQNAQKQQNNDTQGLCIKCKSCLEQSLVIERQAPQFETRTFSNLSTAFAGSQDSIDEEIPREPIENHGNYLDACKQVISAANSLEARRDHGYSRDTHSDQANGNCPSNFDIPPLYDFLVVKKSKIHGLGLFTEVSISKGTLIILYEGERIGKCLSDKRERLYCKNNIYSVYMFKITDDLIVDATFIGNKARYINQSCDPNCYTHTNTVSGRISYYSERDIEPGEELVINYHFDYEKPNEICLCGAPNCRSAEPPQQ